MNISLRIKEARRARGLTQRGLADALGITGSAVNQWESVNNGTEPSAENLRKLATELHVSYEWLAMGSDPSAITESEPTGCNALSTDEKKILSWYRELPAKKRAAILQLIKD